MTQPAPSHTHETPRVSWFELFYDLVMVAAISQAGKIYVKQPTWEMTGLIAAGILMLFTTWLLTTLGYGLFRRDSATRRVILLVQMLAVILAALSLGKNGLPNWVGFTSIAVVMLAQALIFGLYARTATSPARHLRTLAVSALLAAVLWGASVWVITVVPAAAVTMVAPALLALGCAVILVPLLGSVIPKVLPSMDLPHLDERFGLLVIIVLGESFINLVGNLGTLGAIPNPFAFALTFLVTYALWSIYFTSVQVFGMPQTARSLRLWVVAHFLLVVSVVAVAVEFTDLTIHAVADLDITSNGNWTPLPMLGAIAAVALMTWRSQSAPRAMLRVHVVAITVLIVLTVIDLARGVEQVPWFTFAGAFVVIGDSVACAVIRRAPAGV